jgi:tryptophan halogenase
MEIPDSLRRKMDLYPSRGRIVRDNNELFAEVGWLQVLHGQGIKAGGYHPLVDLLTEQEVGAYLEEIAGVVRKCVNVMPTHRDCIAALVAKR